MTKRISNGFLLATILGALPLVGGIGAIVLNWRFHYGEPVLGSAVAAVAGALLIFLAVCAENAGRWQKRLAIARDTLVVLFCIGLLLILALILIGPLH